MRDGSQKDSGRALQLIESADPNDEAPETGLPEFTDKGNGERLALKHGNDLRFVYDWNRWVVWDGSRWAVDKTAGVMRLCKQIVGVDLPNEKRLGVDYNTLDKFVKASQSLRGLRAMQELAQSELPIPVVADSLDRDPMLFNVANGTIDLKSGDFITANRAHLITKIAPYSFDAAAECPNWLAFLRTVMGGDDGLVHYLQKAVGYCLTGKTSERAIFLLYGKGRNGKSTFLEVVRALLGDYAMRTPTETLLARDRGSIPNDIARLKGARFVIASETDEGAKLAAATLKALAGGDVVSARFLRAEYFEFMPTFKIFIGTNHRPRVPDSSRAIWDRIKEIPFEVRISDEDANPNLVEELKAELPGILNWALAGCLEWQAAGLGTCERVTAATKDYQAEQDQLGNFLTEACVVAATARVSKDELYRAYQKWCEATGEYPVKFRNFNRRLVDREFEEDPNRSTVRCWKGLGLRAHLSTNAPSEDRIKEESDRIANESDLFK